MKEIPKPTINEVDKYIKKGDSVENHVNQEKA